MKVNDFKNWALYSEMLCKVLKAVTNSTITNAYTSNNHG